MAWSLLESARYPTYTSAEGTVVHYHSHVEALGPQVMLPAPVASMQCELCLRLRTRTALVQLTLDQSWLKMPQRLQRIVISAAEFKSALDWHCPQMHD